MFDTFQSRLTVEGYLVADSALRVGTGRVSAITGTELPSSAMLAGTRSSPAAVSRGHCAVTWRAWCADERRKMPI